MSDALAQVVRLDPIALHVVATLAPDLASTMVPSRATTLAYRTDPWTAQAVAYARAWGWKNGRPPPTAEQYLARVSEAVGLLAPHIATLESCFRVGGAVGLLGLMRCALVSEQMLEQAPDVPYTGEFIPPGVRD